MQVSVTLCRVNIPVQTKGCLCKYVYMLTDVLCVQAVMLYFSSFLIIHQLYYSLCLQSTYLLSTNELLHSMATRNYLCSVIFMLLLFFYGICVPEVSYTHSALMWLSIPKGFTWELTCATTEKSSVKGML